MIASNFGMVHKPVFMQIPLPPILFPSKKVPVVQTHLYVLAEIGEAALVNFNCAISFLYLIREQKLYMIDVNSQNEGN